MATGCECCGAAACCASLWAALSACYSNISSGCGGGPTCVFGATCGNICNFMNCCNRMNCCNQTNVEGGTYAPTEITNIVAGAGDTDGGASSGVSRINNAAARALQIGADAVAANRADGLGVSQSAAPPPNVHVVMQQPRNPFTVSV